MMYALFQLSKKETFVPGVWGPYYSCMVPGLWGNEGGESCTGKLIDHIIQTHPAVDLLTEQSKKRYEITIKGNLSKVLLIWKG